MNSRTSSALEEGETKLAQHYGFEGSTSDFFKHHDWINDPLYWKFRDEALIKYKVGILFVKGGK